ncbi:hypothetical protein [Alicycliphilus denitrificans]|uniref:hypothetical protein n=1 Tax=Alicycliphilus denitrificans TaxID=179636 RepID=UPI00384E133D
MKTFTIARILRATLHSQSSRAAYWRAATLVREIGALFRPCNQAFRRQVVKEMSAYLILGTRPIEGEVQIRMRSAVDWILRAQAAAGDGGVALGYFPCDDGAAGWRASYPETTGYIITSLLAYASRFGDAGVAEAAMRMAYWEVSVQMASGAVQGGALCPPERQTAAAFNTGMVLDGWCSAYVHSGDSRILEAARSAADFLVQDLDDQGFFRTNGSFVSTGEVKTYTCLCAWAIYRFGDITNEERYHYAAVRIIEAAVRQQQPNGWFAHNCLNRSDAPLTHTIGYTLQGILEVGMLAGRSDFISAVERTLVQLLPRRSVVGYLPGRFFADWEPACFSSCLTGAAQIAIVCYRFADHTGKLVYREHADQLVNYLKAHQQMQSDNPAMEGALAGSYPLFGGYMRAGYPNWATKYLLDALMLQGA